MCAHFQDVTGISSNRRFCHLYIRLESLDLKYQPHKDNIDQTRSNSQKCGFHRTYFKSIPTRQERAERVPFTNQALNVVLSPVVKGSPPATWPAGPPWSRPPGWPVWGWRVPGRGGQAGRVCRRASRRWWGAGRPGRLENNSQWFPLTNIALSLSTHRWMWRRNRSENSSSGWRHIGVGERWKFPEWQYRQVPTWQSWRS